jgi:predicted RNase H-like HicB family nuclease
MYVLYYFLFETTFFSMFIDGTWCFVYTVVMKKPSRTILSYAVFEPAVEGGFNVSFPAFPGCVTFGKTFEEAQSMARDVLTLWIAELRAQNIPTPSARTTQARPIIDQIEVAVSR